MDKLPFSTFLMDRVRRVTEIGLATGKVNWSAVGIGSPSLELNGETIDKQDAYGAMIAQIDTAKGAALSFEIDTINLQVLAAQRGAKVEVGSETNKIKGEIFDIQPVKDGKATWQHYQSLRCCQTALQHQQSRTHSTHLPLLL